MHVSGLREEAREPRKKPHRHGENIQISHRKVWVGVEPATFKVVSLDLHYFYTVCVRQTDTERESVRAHVCIKAYPRVLISDKSEVQSSPKCHRVALSRLPFTDT